MICRLIATVLMNDMFFAMSTGLRADLGAPQSGDALGNIWQYIVLPFWVKRLAYRFKAFVLRSQGPGCGVWGVRFRFRARLLHGQEIEHRSSKSLCVPISITVPCECHENRSHCSVVFYTTSSMHMTMFFHGHCCVCVRDTEEWLCPFEAGAGA